MSWLFGGWSLGVPGESDEAIDPRGRWRRSGADAVPGEPDAGTMPSDDRRLERIRSGDETVFAELYDMYFSDLAALAFRFVGEAAAAHDVVHDVFLKVWSMHSVLDIRTTLEAYLFSSVANRARDVLAQARRHEAILAPLSDDGEGHISSGASLMAVSPHDALESSDVEHAVMVAVAALPERQRLAFTLRLVNDMTYEEIASVLGITKASVAKLLHKAHAHLISVLGPLLS